MRAIQNFPRLCVSESMVQRRRKNLSISSIRRSPKFTSACINNGSSSSKDNNDENGSPPCWRLWRDLVVEQSIVSCLLFNMFPYLVQHHLTDMTSAEVFRASPLHFVDIPREFRKIFKAQSGHVLRGPDEHMFQQSWLTTMREYDGDVYEIQLGIIGRSNLLGSVGTPRFLRLPTKQELVFLQRIHVRLLRFQKRLDEFCSDFPGAAYALQFERKNLGVCICWLASYLGRKPFLC